MNDTTVNRLHRSLVDALRGRPGGLDKPVTVAEIYQDLVPYKTARGAVGFEMNADYEHTLLRLLAGEGDLARIEPREVRDKLRLELESPNPDVGLFRNYAACDVWVNVGDALNPEEPPVQNNAVDSWEDEFLGSTTTHAVSSTPFEIAPDIDDVDDDDADDDDIDVDVEIEDPETEGVEVIDADTGESDVGNVPDELEAAAPKSTASPGQSPTEDIACVFCGADLPDDRMVNFCPFCGTDQSQRPCPSCGEVLDPLWRFCVGCGTRVRPLGDHVN